MREQVSTHCVAAKRTLALQAFTSVKGLERTVSKQFDELVLKRMRLYQARYKVNFIVICAAQVGFARIVGLSRKADMIDSAHVDFPRTA